MTQKRETRRQRKIRAALEAAFPGSYWRKIWGGIYQQGGIADLLGCVEGYFFAFEVKEPDDGESSQLQLDEIEEVLEAGGCSSIVYTPDEAIGLVRKTLSRARKRR